MTEDGDISILELRKKSWPERKVRRWWMQRQLWKSYEKCLHVLWAEYELELTKGNKELSDALFLQMLEFRKFFEEGRAVINAAFELSPRKVPLNDDEVPGP